jgi:uncharacterized protein
MFHRIFKPLESQSFFLFGPRGSGKTTYLRAYFEEKNTVWIDLLDYETEDKYSKDPGILLNELRADCNMNKWVVIDEVQKVPKLLDIVHKVIETKNLKYQFALTGSSARKLKRGAANLLAGRAFLNYLHPLTFIELESIFNLDDILMWGALPKIFSLKKKEEKSSFLRTYALTYLNEEIKAEQIVRKLDPFRKFLELAAQMNTEILNFSKIAKQIKVDTKTVQSYFNILEDTLVGFFLEPYHTSIRKRLIESPKFYLFDTGVKRALDRTLNVMLLPQTYEYGRAFEHYIILQLKYLNSYYKKDFSFGFLKTKDDAEVDLVIERPGMPTALVEIKSSSHIESSELNNLKRFKQDIKNSEAYCLYTGQEKMKIDSVNIMPWMDGIKSLL